MTSAEFKPTFNPNVFVMGPWGPQSINPVYCATASCALDLASILADLNPKIVMLYPFGQWPQGNNPFVQSGTVPWFQLPDGTLANVGLLAGYWTHGYPPAVAERYCRQDIALAMQMTAGQ